MSETAQSDAELPPEDRLTVEDAERFAESFRPSWHSLPAVTPSPLPGAAVPVPSAEASDVAIDSVLPRSRRRRSLALVVGAVLLFAGLIAMAMSSAHSPAPHAKQKPSAAAKAPPPAEPVKAEPAAPAAPAPTTLAQPALAAPAPTEPTPAPTAAEPTPAEAIAVPTAQPELAQPTGTAAPAVQPSPTAAAPAAAPIATAVPAAQPERVAPAAAPAEPATVRIQLQTTPETATLLIDGATVGNPYDQRLPKSGKHRVRVQAPGYRESDITLNFDRDRDLSVRLQKLRGRAARRSAPASSVAAPRPAAPAAPPPPVLSIKPAAPEKHAPAKAAPAKTPPKGAGFVSESPY
jgi:hypothetical protein